MTALVPQLSRSSPPPTPRSSTRIVADPGTTLFVAGTAGAIVGMLTLAAFRIPTGVRAWIEDVVVDAAARGGGVAQALVQAALEHVGRARGAHGRPHVASRPRGGQPALPALGFEVRQTNVYRRTLEGT